MVAITKDKPLHAHVSQRLTDAEFGRLDRPTKALEGMMLLMGIGFMTVPVMAISLAVMSPKEVSRKVTQEKKSSSPSQWYPEEDMVGDLAPVVYTKQIDVL